MGGPSAGPHASKIYETAVAISVYLTLVLEFFKSLFPSRSRLYSPFSSLSSYFRLGPVNGAIYAFFLLLLPLPHLVPFIALLELTSKQSLLLSL
ncbi:hypothetical protein BGW80DRAFT_1328678 [Lactifluus volemus]|nr:hypothetical protein BGW80DRAFT_1328678 [Lactifluus volemus]